MQDPGGDHQNATIKALENAIVTVADLGIVTESGVLVAQARGGGIVVNSSVFLDPTHAASNTGTINYLKIFEEAFAEKGVKPGRITTEVFQAIYLLHELGHLTRKLQGDIGSMDGSLSNTVNVIWNCFSWLTTN